MRFMLLVLFVLHLSYPVSMSSPANASSLNMCRATKIVFAISHFGKLTNVTVINKGKDPMFPDVIPEYCNYDYDNQIESNNMSRYMTVSREGFNVIIPKKCYDGASIIAQSLRLVWEDKDFKLIFDEYNSDKEGITKRAIFLINGKVEC